MLKLYNTLTSKKEIFRAKRGRIITMYNCGPTVYNYVHIGNLSAYLMADLIRRYLEYKGYKVKQVKNITDVGHITDSQVDGVDKMEIAARREKKDSYKIAKFYTEAFLEDEKKLNIKKAHFYPRATRHIKEMISLIKILIKKGYAYKTQNGNVYFEVAKFKNYGKLSKNPKEMLASGARIEVRKEKKDPKDFALWISDRNHLMKWKSPWGVGYPGWHIECSAMSMKYLGKTVDIHTGGEDNIFPHHEAEIAQSEAATGKKFVNFWMHKRHLLVSGQKMSKSLGNFYILSDLEKLGFDPIAFRFLVLSSHYMSSLNFSKRAMTQAKESIDRMREFILRLREIYSNGKPKTQVSTQIKQLIAKTQKDFEKYMDDDLNTPKALAALFKFITEVNILIDKNEVKPEDTKVIYKFIIKIDQILGLDLEKAKIAVSKSKEKEIQKLILERENARKEKNWQKADKIREELQKLGVEIKDTKAKTLWRLSP
jgi:cysteinyl-tRNA synthetase